MAGNVGDHHRPIGAFNPAWCLRPQTGCRDTVRRCEDGPPTSISTSSSSSLSSTSSHGRRAHARRRLEAAAEPLSPRVSCMGQIKRDKASGGDGGSSSPARIGLLKLAKFFSGRYGPGTAAAVACPRGARTKRVVGCGGTAQRNICVAKLDPPLPVAKREQGAAAIQVNLCKRRCGRELILECVNLGPQKQLPPLCVYQAVV